MNSTDSLRGLSALNLAPPSPAVSAASAKGAAKAPENKDEKNPAMFSRLLARSRAAAETAQLPPAPSARPAAPAPPNAPPNATRHSATNPNSPTRAERRAHPDGDDRAGDTPDAVSPRGADAPTRSAADAANDAPQRSADGDARAEPSDAAGSTPDALQAAVALDSPSGVTSPLVAGELPNAAALPGVPVPVAGVAPLDATTAPLTHAAGPLAVLGTAGPGSAGIDASAAPMGTKAQAAASAPGDPKLAIDAPGVSLALPHSALAQLAALSAGGGKGDEAPKTPTVLESVLPGASAALAGQGVAAAARWIDNPASGSASVATAVGDPGFHEALAAQVSVFARGGLAKAELQLNPVELGPVSVSITMNGDQARVDFGADRAQTRKAIEAGWAELAASLHDAGFTLSGGGVSEQAGRQAFEREAARPSGRAERPAEADDAPVASIVAARPRAGSALDLYV